MKRFANCRIVTGVQKKFKGIKKSKEYTDFVYDARQFLFGLNRDTYRRICTGIRTHPLFSGLCRSPR